MRLIGDHLKALTRGRAPDKSRLWLRPCAQEKSPCAQHRAVLHPGVPRTLVSEIDRRSSQSPDERSGAGQVAPLASATRAGKVAVCATSQSHPWPSAMCATEKSPCAQRVSHAPGFGHACTPDRVWVTLGLAGWRPPSPAETAGCAHMATGGNSSRAHLPALIRSSLVGASR